MWKKIVFMSQPKYIQSMIQTWWGCYNCSRLSIKFIVLQSTQYSVIHMAGMAFYEHLCTTHYLSKKTDMKAFNVDLNKQLMC